MILSDTMFIRDNDIETAEMDGEIGMLNVHTGKYYMLNEIGGDIWEILEEKMTFSSLVDRLLEVYDVERDLCEKETEKFLNELVENSLVKSF